MRRLVLFGKFWLGVGVAILAAFALIAVMSSRGCGYSALEDRIENEMQAATGWRVSVELPDGHGRDTELAFLAPADGETMNGPYETWDRMGLSTPQTIAAITTFEQFLGAPGPLRESSTLSLIFPYSGGQEIQWVDSDGEQERYVSSVVGSDLPYNESYCALPQLRVLRSVGAGSDFSQIGECNPTLEELGITAWQQSTGHQALSDLGNLTSLEIQGGFDDPAILASMWSLHTLRVQLADDTEEDSNRLRALLPNCDITFL